MCLSSNIMQLPLLLRQVAVLLLFSFSTCANTILRRPCWWPHVPRHAHGHHRCVLRGLLLPGSGPCPAGSFSEDTAISRPAKVRTRSPCAMLWLVQRTALQFLLAALHKSSFSWAGEQQGVLTASSCSETCSTEADKTP